MPNEKPLPLSVFDPRHGGPSKKLGPSKPDHANRKEQKRRKRFARGQAAGVIATDNMRAIGGDRPNNWQSMQSLKAQMILDASKERVAQAEVTARASAQREKEAEARAPKPYVRVSPVDSQTREADVAGVRKAILAFFGVAVLAGAGSLAVMSWNQIFGDKSSADIQEAATQAAAETKVCWQVELPRDNNLLQYKQIDLVNFWTLAGFSETSGLEPGVRYSVNGQEFDPVTGEFPQGLGDPVQAGSTVCGQQQ